MLSLPRGASPRATARPPRLSALGGGELQAGFEPGLGLRVSLTQAWMCACCRVDVAHLILYHLSICCKKKYFDFEREILPFASENWDSLLLGEVREWWGGVTC